MPASLLVASLPVAASPPRAVADATGQFRALRAADARLAAIGFRLATANAALCRDLQPGTGIGLHALDQYDPALRPAAVAVFGFPTPVAVELVVPGSPAARAGLVENDGISAVDRAPVPPGTGGQVTTTTRDAAVALLTDRSPTAPLNLTTNRGGVAHTVTIAPVAECRAGFELVLGSSPVADSDGRQVEVGAAYLARYRDDQVAVIVAHELAHLVLRHRARLEAAGVHWGLLGQIGRSARLFRQTEDQADLLSVALLRNAGYDPALAVRFWQHDIGGLDGGILHGATHSSSGARAKAIAAEIARIPADAPTPYVPPVLATRDDDLR